MAHPPLIQGGMGVAVSHWRLARAVASAGQLGVVSGAGLDLLLTRRLQLGDPEGHYRRALGHFPVREIAERIRETHFIEGGKAPDEPFRRIAMHTAVSSNGLATLALVANFAEVWLAKEGHAGVVGINYLEKMQLPLLPSLYGAMLAGVDYVLVGAGVPREIPGVLDRLARHEDVSLRLHVEGAGAEDDFRLQFHPRGTLEAELPPLRRPYFLAIVASNALATTMIRKANGRVDGLVIEGPTAGGHNAPPRGPLALNERGEPRYGPRDEVDLGNIRDLGVPFWLAGSYGRPGRLREARALGAAGVQVGTAFAFCRESGLDGGIRRSLLERARRGSVDVTTDPFASPTGFPFKVARLEGTLSELDVYEQRPRRCDVGYLRHPYRKADGSLGYRCPAEPVEVYVGKGGVGSETVGRKCLCNALLANVGLAQLQEEGYVERPLVTSGDDLAGVGRFLAPGADSYSALDVIRRLLEETSEAEFRACRDEAGESSVEAVDETETGGPVTP